MTRVFNPLPPLVSRSHTHLTLFSLICGFGLAGIAMPISATAEQTMESFANPGKAWKPVHCKRHCSWDYQHVTLGSASTNGKMWGLERPYQPQMLLKISTGIYTAEAALTESPSPMCADSKKKCTFTATIGQDTRQFDFVPGTAQVKEALAFNNFIYKADEFTIRYVDQYGKNVKILFPSRY
jgi:hypothetical protein